jgi:hypothetical protein
MINISIQCNYRTDNDHQTSPIFRYEKHTTASTKFATVQRNIYHVLQTESDSGIAKKLVQLTSDFNSAREVMPIVDNDVLASYLGMCVADLYVVGCISTSLLIVFNT